MTDEEMIAAVLAVLRELVTRVKRRAPSALGGAGYAGGLQPYASFARTGSHHSIDLCVQLQPHADGRVSCEAGLVLGSGTVLGEMPELEITNPNDPETWERLLGAIRGFTEYQEDNIVRELLRED